MTHIDGESWFQPELPLDWPVGTGTDDLPAVRAANQVKYRELTAPLPDGRQLMPDPVGILATRVQALIDMLVDPQRRDEFDLAFETAMSSVLDECLAQRAQAILAVAPPGLLLPR